MRRLLPFPLSVIIFIACVTSLTCAAFAQQVPVSGSLGLPGSASILGYQSLSMTDADLTLTPVQWAHNYLNVTSSVALTATRSIIVPLNPGQQFTVENNTTGGQSIKVIGATGTGATVLNGTTVIVGTEGTNYYATSGIGGVTALSVAAANGFTGTSSGGTTPTLTLNVDSSHFLPITTGSSSLYLNQQGGYTTPPGSSSAGTLGQPQVGDGAGGFLAGTPAQMATSLISGALNNFHTALYTAQQLPPATGAPSTSTNILVIGTSITCCIGPTTPADSPIAQLKNILQQYGSNGGGIIPVGANATTFTRPEWTLAGTWTTVADLGPTQTNASASFNSIFVASGNGAGNTLTMTGQTGDKLLLLAETTTDSGGCAVSVDGGSPGTFANTTSVSPTMVLTSFSPGPGYHSIVVQPSGAGKCYFYGAGFVSSANSGIIVNNFAHGYATTNAFCVNPTTQMAMVPLISPVPSLAIIELGVNEIIEGTMSQSTYASQMQSCITYLRGLNPNMSILLLDDYNINPASIGSGITYAQVRTTEQALALSNNAAYMSIGDSWGTYAQANALGLMAGDGLHPSNNGGILYATTLASYILQSVGTLPTRTIRPFVVQQETPSDVSQFPLLSNNTNSPSTTVLFSGLNLYCSPSAGHYCTGLMLGVNHSIGGYGPLLYNNEGNSNVASEFICGWYNNSAGFPANQAAITDDCYFSVADHSYHVLNGGIYSNEYIGNGSAPGLSFSTGAGTIVSSSTNVAGTFTTTTTGAIVFTLTWSNSFAYPNRGICRFNDETTHTSYANEILTSGATTTTLTAGGTTVSGDTISYSCTGY